MAITLSCSQPKAQRVHFRKINSINRLRATRLIPCLTPRLAVSQATWRTDHAHCGNDNLFLLNWYPIEKPEWQWDRDTDGPALCMLWSQWNRNYSLYIMIAQLSITPTTTSLSSTNSTAYDLQIQAPSEIRVGECYLSLARNSFAHSI